MSPNAAKPPLSRQQSNNPPSPPQKRLRMPILFNTIRASIYGTVLLFTVICVSMAGHFQSVLAASDLTRFVPFAIFVCAASLFIFMILLCSSYFLGKRNPISTRIELSSLGLAGMFWLILGVYLTISEAQSADVECFSSTDLEVPLDDEIANFHTDQYQSMYRVLNVFALMNAALVIFSCVILLFLAVRRHRKGDEHMWHGPVTSCAWFNNYENAKLTRGKSSSSSILPIASAQGGNTVFTEKPERSADVRRERSSRRQQQRSNNHSSEDRGYHSSPQRPSRRAAPPATYVRHGSGGSSPRTGTTMPDIEHGGMLNPYSRTRGAQSSRR